MTKKLNAICERTPAQCVYMPQRRIQKAQYPIHHRFIIRKAIAHPYFLHRVRSTRSEEREFIKGG
jgi:hypothetical protein